MTISRRPLSLLITLVLTAAAALAVTPAAARGQDAWAAETSAVPAWAAEPHAIHGAPEFSLGLGYANITLDGSPVIDNESALRWDPTLSFAPFREPLPQLRLGVGVGVNLVLDNNSRTLISNNGQLLFIGSSDVPLWLIEPELRLSWRQYLGEAFFIEGGGSVGVAFGFLELDAEDGSGDSYEENDSAVYGRVFLRAGGLVTGGLAGVEASYTAGDTLDFGGNAAGDLGEWYIGIFGALAF